MIVQPAVPVPGWLRKRFRHVFGFTLPVVLSVLVTCMIWVVTAYELHEIHEKAISAEKLRMNANARFYEEQVLRAIETLDQGLLALRHDAEMEHRVSDINGLLHAIQINRKFIGIVSVMDANGRVVASTNPIVGQDYSDRDYFKHHAAHPTDALHIGAPILGRFSGVWSIPMTRAIHTSSGDFNGIVYVAVEPAYFAASSEQVVPGQNGSMAVIGLDGITRARNNNGKLGFGDDVRASQLFKEITQSKVGQYQARAVSDGVLRIVSYRVLENYPLIVVSAAALDAVEASLRNEQVLYLSFAVVATVLFLSFVAVTRVSLRRSRRDVEKLRQSRENLRAMINASPTPMAMNDNARNITYLNPAFVSTYGYTVDDIPTVDRWWPAAYPDAQYRASVAARWVDALRQCDAQGTPFEPMEVRIRCKDGTTKFAMVAAAPLLSDFKAEHVVTLHDITLVHETNAALTALVNEKNALLREVHHRVKNNLQVITSLLRLESSRSTHADTRSVLDAMHGRIRSMALMHESLYQTNVFAAIDLSVYLESLATEAMRAMSPKGSTVHLDCQLQSVWVTMDQATSCGLLVNELISNALKHGFKEGTGGRIALRLLAGPGTDDVTLQVEDDGVGLPLDWESRSGNSLGLQLVDDLAQQLGGSLVVGPAPRALFTVVFVLQSTTGHPPLTH